MLRRIYMLFLMKSFPIFTSKDSQFYAFIHKGSTTTSSFVNLLPLASYSMIFFSVQNGFSSIFCDGMVPVYCVHSL